MEIKQQRRTLKNKGYASNCRVKRENEERELEWENQRLRQQIQKYHTEEYYIRAIQHLEKSIPNLKEESVFFSTPTWITKIKPNISDELQGGIVCSQMEITDRMLIYLMKTLQS